MKEERLVRKSQKSRLGWLFVAGGRKEMVEIDRCSGAV